MGIGPKSGGRSQQYLGHADMAMTMRYSHLSPAARQDYIKVLDGAR